MTTDKTTNATTEGQNIANKFLMAGKTKTIKGTILMPEMAGLRLILTLASENGKPDSDLYNLLDKKWRTVKAELKGWNQFHVTFKMGNVQTTSVNSDIWVMHMLCLDKDGQLVQGSSKNPKTGKVTTVGLDACLQKVAQTAKEEKASVHVSTLLTAAYPELEAKLKEYFLDKGTTVYFYAEAK